MLTGIDKFNSPIKLEAGKEYFIEISPKGQKASEAFKALNEDQRKCKLESDVIKGSIFKKYTKNNCKYECHVEKARNNCGCKPWDFLIQDKLDDKEEECDVFGRTCFFNTMQMLLQMPNTSCPQCQPECEYINYEKIVTGVQDLVSGYFSGGKFFMEAFDYDSQTRKIKGNKAFIEFLMDKNDIILERGLKNAYDALTESNEYSDAMPRGKYRDMIVLHLTYTQPQIDVINTKYSITDMIASFGGKFGIFAQVTGWSFLGILNFLLLFGKLFSFSRSRK